jgi:hypothetical protein
MFRTVILPSPRSKHGPHGDNHHDDIHTDLFWNLFSRDKVDKIIREIKNLVKGEMPSPGNFKVIAAWMKKVQVPKDVERLYKKITEEYNKNIPRRWENTVLLAFKEDILSRLDVELENDISSPQNRFKVEGNISTIINAAISFHENAKSTHSFKILDDIVVMLKAKAEENQAKSQSSRNTSETYDFVISVNSKYIRILEEAKYKVDLVRENELYSMKS